MNQENLRTLVLSDLHFEFHADSGMSFMASMPKDIDILVVAGDLTNAAGLSAAIPLLCASAPEVVYVLGNHELYGSSPSAVYKTMERLAKKHSNLHWLDESVVTIQGQRFVGSTLWFRDDPNAFRFRSGMNDFREIQGFVPWCFAKGEKAAKFLRKSIQPGDVVVTHHLPSKLSIQTKWRDSSLQSFFLNDLDPLVSQCRAKLWVHGHTHDSLDYMVGNPQLGETRVLCNPFGYARVAENREFRPIVVET